MAENYFIETEVNAWSPKEAFQKKERTVPALSSRKVLHLLKDDLQATAESEGDKTRAEAAKRLLSNWKSFKNSINRRPSKKSKRRSNLTINNNDNQGQINIYTQSSSSSVPTSSTEKASYSSNASLISNTNNNNNSKRERDEDEKSEWSWKSIEKRRKTKFIEAYTSTCYEETDFGGQNDKSIGWKISELDMTKLLKEYREISEEGAQMRKNLSIARILSLSFIFLFSLKERCVITPLPIQKQCLILKDLNLKKDLTFVDDEVVLAARKVQKILYKEDITKDQNKNELDSLKASTSNADIKTLINIANSIMPQLLGFEFSNCQKGETNQIIEMLRPFFVNCWSSKIEGIKSEWLTYHLLPAAEHSHNQIMMPDYVLFVEPFSNTTFEICYVEVKRKGNYSNNSGERDLVKLGKEMQIGLNKLVFQGVPNPVIVGVLIEEDCAAKAYKMDLKFGNIVDDVLLIPTALEKLAQLRVIMETTLKDLYLTIENSETKVDHSTYVRKPSDAPVRAASV